MIDNIKTALQQKITDDGEKKVLALTQHAFPGIIQTIIGDYLNGVTINLGSAATLTIKPASKELELKATLAQTTFDLVGNADKAVLTVTSTAPDMVGALIKLTFTKSGQEISLALDVEMGSTLHWQVKDLWPTYLDWSPANELMLAKGKLALSVASGPKIDFTGQGTMLLNNNPLANGAVRVDYADNKTNVLVGIVVPHWSPGDYWPPLKSLSFNNSGLVFTTRKAKSSTLNSLGLISAAQVPAIGGDFDIEPGMVFFTSLELDGALKSVANFMGTSSTLDLFASYAKTTQVIDLKASLLNEFGVANKAIFKFNGFTLDWADPTDAGGTITASALGHFYPTPHDSVELDLSGSIIPRDGNFAVNFSLKNWQHPFGIKTLTINEATAGFTVGAQAEGVTIVFGGDIKLQNPSDPANEFTLGMAAEIADFEVPTGIALWMDAQYKALDFSSALNAAFAVPMTPNALRRAGEYALADIVTVIDEVIQVKQFEFWFVEGSTIKKIGTHGPYAAGFGLKSDFDLFEQEQIVVSVTVDEKGSDPGFSGAALFKQEIKFGDVLTIAGWDPHTNGKTNAGPAFAISATKAGTIIPNVNDNKPVYFYADGYLSFMDLITEHIYGIATPDGMFEFSESVQAGTPVGTAGAWAGDTITFGVNPKKYQLDAGFSFKFGWSDVSWPAINLWGITLIPSASLPNFDVAAGLNVHVDVLQSIFILKGHFDFDFLGAKLNWGSSESPKTLLDLNLVNAVNSIGEIATKLLAKLFQIVGQLLEALLDDVKKFLDWIGKQLSKFVDGVKVVAQILAAKFKQLGQDIVNSLKSIGVEAAKITQVLVHELGYALDDVEDWLKGVSDCAVQSASNLLG